MLCGVDTLLVLTDSGFLLLDILQGCCRNSPLALDNPYRRSRLLDRRRGPNWGGSYLFEVCIYILLLKDGIRLSEGIRALIRGNLRRIKMVAVARVFDRKMVSGRLRP